MRRLALLAFVSAAAAGCESPEAVRQRGGGQGADPGNRPAEVMMHEGSRQYWQTPVLIDSEGPPLAPSEQARRLSLPSAARERRSSAADGGRGQ